MHTQPSKELCFSVLHRLYLQCGKKAGVSVRYAQENGGDSLSYEQVRAVVELLHKDALVQFEPEVGFLSLSELGVAIVGSALAAPERAAGGFPPLASFFGLSGDETVGLCRATLSVWLDQLRGCSGALEHSAQCAEASLERGLAQLEECVMRSQLDQERLVRGLADLKKSL